VTSVALVVLDTVRYDAFASAFDRLDGAWFARAYSTSHWTVPAHASLFTGRYASEVGVHGRSPTMDWAGRTLPEAFADAGHRTIGLTANPQFVRYDGWERGFDVFDGAANVARADDAIYDWEALIESTDPGPARYLRGLYEVLTTDCDTRSSLRYGYGLHRTPSYAGGVDDLRTRLAGGDFDDAFLFANVMDAHTPYRPAPGTSEPGNVVVADALAGDVTDPERLRAAYDESVRHLAAVYRDVHERLREQFDYVVTLSDHGECLGEHGLWNHSVGIHPELVHVPLVVAGDDVPDGVVHDPVDLRDVHRTVAELADVDVDSDGRDLLAGLEPTDSPELAVDLEPTTHLTESHGLLPFHRRQFERKGLPDAEYERWRTPLSGYVDERGRYAYEPEPGAFRVVGDLQRDAARRRLDDLTNALDRREVVEGDAAVSDVALARLEELGYA